jgi:hypothetical protein
MGAGRRCLEGWATLCLQEVLGRTYVDAWTGAASGGSFRAVAQVFVHFV